MSRSTGIAPRPVTNRQKQNAKLTNVVMIIAMHSREWRTGLCSPTIDSCDSSPCF
jgi:hypothetical protein